MKTNPGRRWLSLLLTLALCLTLAPAALAAEGDGDTQFIFTDKDDKELSQLELFVKTQNNDSVTVKAAAFQGETELLPDQGAVYEFSGSGEIIDVDGNAEKREIKITPKKEGSATVTVTVTKDGETATASLPVKVTQKMESLRLSSNSLIMEVNGSEELAATPVPDSAKVKWESSDTDVVYVRDSSNTSWKANLSARKPGKATIKATIGTEENNMVTAECEVEVSGIVLEQKSVSLKEGQREDIPHYTPYGAAKDLNPTYQSTDPSVVQVLGGQLEGRGPGTTTVSVFVGPYSTTFDVTVSADSNTTLDDITISSGGTLKFNTRISDFEKQAQSHDGKLSHLTSLSVPTSQGTLYYGYKSEGEPGAGVAQNGNYYANPSTGQNDLADVTFVPNPYFTGGRVTITYTLVTTNQQRYNGRIMLEVTQSASGDLSLNTTVNTPVALSGNMFSQAAQRITGAPLSHVVFSLPSENRGTLYYDYVSEDNYGYKLAVNGQYGQSQLDNISFVPAPGFTGTVTIYYTGYSVGAYDNQFSGTLTITVGSRNTSGGPSYTIAQGGVASFNDEDFGDYCAEILQGYSRSLSYVRFDSLPNPDQGTLYYDYRSANNTGSRVSTGETYYYGSRSLRLDKVSFAANPDFTGIVSIPFTGWDTSGTHFSGTVEINVRASGGSGDIHYSVAPGKAFTLKTNDFNDLCNDLTHRNLNYIVFQALPDRKDGTLYYNRSSSDGGSRVNTSQRYSRSAGSYRIDRVSFVASSSFSGSIDIPFEGCASNTGDTFTGVITIHASDSPGGNDVISYSTGYQEAVLFDDADFNDLCQWETDKNLNYVRFDLPSASQGTLYQNYRASSSSNTKVSANSRYYRSSSPRIDQVAFVPASGFSGTAAVDFTATATDGSQFDGTVEIQVGEPQADASVRYYTQTRPVTFRATDFEDGSRYSLSSIRFNAMPSANAGHLYYQYTSPTQYGRQASAGTSYGTSGSNLISQLTFVPRAGYQGTVVLPFTGTNSNNSTFLGEVIITVQPTSSSSYFSDMASYSGGAKAAVDFLLENGITSGISASQFGPEGSIRRGDFALMMYQAFGLAGSASSGSYFNDVSPSDYYGKAVNTLYSMGIVTGRGSGRYDPSGTLSRQDAMLMVQKAMRAVGWSASDGPYSYLTGYHDAGQVASYAQGAMAYVIQMGILPTDSGRLAPNDPLTRVDMAQVLHRALTY